MERKQDGNGSDRAKSVRWTEKDGARAVAAWRQSGLGRAEYCKREGVAPHRVAYWELALAAKGEQDQSIAKRQSRRVAESAPTFLPVVVRGDVPTTQRRAQRGAVAMSASEGRVDPEWVARFVRALFCVERDR